MNLWHRASAMMRECTREAMELRALPPDAAAPAGEEEGGGLEDCGGLEDSAWNSDATRRRTSLMPASLLRSLVCLVCLWQRIFDADTCRCSCTSCPTGTRRVDGEHGVADVNLLEDHVVLGERA
jgi:hypothetical protein